MNLSEIQRTLEAPKNQFNKFGNYKYRNCEDILSAVKPLLEGSILTLNDDIVNIGVRFYVKATAKFIDAEGKVTEVSAFAREEDSKKGFDASQLTGSTSSYARKYALNGLFLIDDTKDADTGDNRDKGKKQPSGMNQAPPPENMNQTPATINTDQCTFINDLFNEHVVDITKFLAWMKVERVEDIMVSSFDVAVKALQKKPLKGAA